MWCASLLRSFEWWGDSRGKDHRGRTVSIPRALPQRCFTQREEGGAAQVRAAVVRLDEEHKPRSVLLLCLTVGSMALLARAVIAGLDGEVTKSLVGLGVAVAVWLGAAHLWSRRLAARADGFIDVCLSGGLCPTCGYCLTDIASGTDGCRTCPECGGSWRCALSVPKTPSGPENALRAPSGNGGGDLPPSAPR